MSSINVNSDYFHFVYAMLLILSMTGLAFQRREFDKGFSFFLAAAVFLFSLYQFILAGCFYQFSYAATGYIKLSLFSMSFVSLYIYLTKNFTKQSVITVTAYPLIVAATAIIVVARYDVGHAQLLLYYILAIPVSSIAFILFMKNINGSIKRVREFFIPALFIAVFALSWLLSFFVEDYGHRFTGARGAAFVILQIVSVFFTGLWFFYLRRITRKRDGVLVSSYLVTVSIITVMAGGWFYTEWKTSDADENIRRKISRQVRDISEAVDPYVVAKLGFTKDDIVNPHFQMLRRQMVLWSERIGAKYIYSIALIDGKYLFGPENIPENDPLASHPGTVYARPDPRFARVFRSAAHEVIGPYGYEYGSFISVYSPVIDPVSGRVVLAIGIDIGADEWYSEIESVRRGAIADVFALMLLVFTAGLFLFFRDRKWRDRKEFVFVQMESLFVLALGMIITGFIITVFMHFDRKKESGNFAYISDYSASAIHQEMLKIAYDADDLSKFIRNSEYVTSDEFISFTSGMRTGGVIARGWAPAVRDTGRGGFEERLTRMGAGGRGIHRLNEKGKKVYSPRSEFYFPILFLEKSYAGGMSGGYDILSRQDYAAAAEISSAVKMPVVAGYSIRRDSNDQSVVLDLLCPVIKAGGEKPAGYIITTADINRALENAMSFTRSESIPVSAQLIDMDEDGAMVASYSSVSEYPSMSGPSVNEGWLEYPVFIFNRVFCIRIYRPALQGFGAIPASAVMGGASGIILSVAVFLLTLMKRRREFFLEEVIAERTSELTESEERFRILSEAAQGGIAIHDNGIILECNRRFAEMSGYSEQQLKGMNGLDMIAPEYREYVKTQLLSGADGKYDTFALKRDGSIFPVEIFGRPIPFRGRLLRVTEFRDISDRKETENMLKSQREEIEAANEELQAQMEEYEALNSELLENNKLLIESEEKFSRAFNINPSAMSIRNMDGIYIDVNESFLKTFGFEKESVIGKTAHELGLRSNKTYEDKLIELVSTEGRVRNFELVMKIPDGRTIYCFISIDILIFNDNHFVLEVLTDITDRKKFEAALEASEKKYRLLFETAGDAIIFLDEEIFIDCNKKAEALYGCSRERLIGNSPAHFSPEYQPDGELSAEKALKKMTAAYEGEPQFFEWVHCRFDGSIFEAEISLNAFNSDGKRFMIGVVRDISERKKYEIRLSHMQKMDAIGQLAGGVAHDFNNQLSGVLGYAEILASRLGDSPLKKYADNIISVAMRSADLTKKLLAFARKGQLQVTPVDLHVLIDETIEMLKHSIDKRIAISREFSAANSVVYGDSAQLQNVLLNLGLNARDAMPEGGALAFKTENAYIDDRQLLTGSPDMIHGHFIIISVSDTGAGMTENVKKHLFEPFFTTKKAGRGTGMGLASVYGTVKNHNGAVNVYSEENRGTVFKIYFPVSGDNTDSIKMTVSDDDIVIPSLKILVVDDEEPVRLSLSEMLRDMGYEVIEAVNGRDGINIYNKTWSDIDLVIIDMIMPEVGGHDAFLEMKKTNPGIKAIAASGFSMDKDARSILADGVLGFIQKPCRKAELLKKISEVLGAKQQSI